MSFLEVVNVSKKFAGKKGEVVAVDDVSFTADAGEIFGLLGPNGAGKTTTIRLISTILKPTGGTVRVAGHDILKEPEQVRRSIGMLTTDVGLYDRFTARENLRYFGELYGLVGEKLEQRIDGLITLLEMEEFADRRAGKFSTGMKQKVAIARSVIHDPQVIIFDEPTSGLDVLASQTVVSFMKRSQQAGKLVILSTHEMHNAEKLCERVAIIHHGKLVTLDSVKSVEEKNSAHSLEEAFLKIIKASPHLESRSDDIVKKKQSFFSSSGITLGQRTIAWWRIAVLLVVIGMVIYKFIAKR